MFNKKNNTEQQLELPLGDDSNTPAISVNNFINEEDRQSSGSIAVYEQNPVFDSQDIAPAMIRLAQGLTPEVQAGAAKPGQWIIPGFEPFDSVTVVPLLFAKRREYRDEEGLLRCTSDNSYEGTGDPGGVCEECPMNKWTGSRDKRRPPACTFMYAYVVYIVETDSVALLHFKKTSIGVGRMMNSMVAQKGMRQIAIRLMAQSQSGRKGSYFTPKITPITGDKADTAIKAALNKGF